MKKFILAAALGLGVFTVVTTTANTHVVNTSHRTIVADTDTTKTPVPDSLSLSFAK